MKNSWLSRRKFGLHIKWTSYFVLLLLVAQVVTVIISFGQAINETMEILRNQLIDISSLIIHLDNMGVHIGANILDILGESDLNLVFISNYEPQNLLIPIDAINDITAGEIFLAYIDRPFHRMPQAFFRVGQNIAMLSPPANQNEMNIFIEAIGRSILVNVLLSSIFLSSALFLIVKRIKKVSLATRQIAKGNFNINLKSNTSDEIGELANSFNFMVDELKKIDYLKKDFVSGVSHEFKTPITAIEGYAKLLKDENLTPEKIDEYTDIIIKETARLSNLSTNLLRITVLDNSDFITDKTPFYIDEQIRHVILLLEKFWSEKNIEFDIEMSEILYNGNEELLSQVFINLLHNAIKFSPKNSEIGVYIEKNPSNIIIKIKDKGPGIAEPHQNRIFDKFYRAAGKTTSGNGLGLAIAKRIVELSKGEIWFETQVGRGSTFFVKLPM